MCYIVKRGIEIFREKGCIAFIREFLRYILNQLILPPYAMFKIRDVDQHYSLDELVNFTFTWCLGVIKPSQVRYEILELLKILDKTKPKFVLEIGTANGGTLFLFSHVASEDAIIISIDLPGGRFGGGYFEFKAPLYKSFALKSQRLHLIRADSHKRSTLEEVKAILNGRNIDFLFIDGDHTYEGVKKDFEMYSPLTKKNGVIVLHDIIARSPEIDFGVSRFWNEIKSKYEHIEIVKNWNQKWAGIGLVKNVKI